MQMDVQQTNYKIKMKDFFKDLKKQIITGVGIAIATLSTVFIDVIKEKLGIAEEKIDQIEQVIEQPSTPNIIINIPEQKKDTVVKKVYVKPKPKKTETEKRKEEGFDW